MSLSFLGPVVNDHLTGYRHYDSMQTCLLAYDKIKTWRATEGAESTSPEDEAKMAWLEEAVQSVMPREQLYLPSDPYFDFLEFQSHLDGIVLAISSWACPEGTCFGVGQDRETLGFWQLSDLYPK